MVKKRRAAAPAAAEEPPAPVEEPPAPAEEPAPRPKKRKRREAAAEAEAAPAAEPAEPAPAPLAKRKKKSAGAPGDAEAAGAGQPVANARSKVDCTVFVDGVPYVWTLEKIKEFFGECGEVLEVRAPTWQDSGRLRGFAHVTFATPAAQKKALKMDGAKVGNKARYLKIEPAKTLDATPAAPTVDLEGKRRLFVKNLPYDVTEAEIHAIFAPCGKVNEVRVPTSFGRSKGFAYVEFAQCAALKAAIKRQPPAELRGRTLRLDADVGSGPKAGFHFRPEAYETGFGPRKQKNRSGYGGGGRPPSLL